MVKIIRLLLAAITLGIMPAWALNASAQGSDSVTVRVPKSVYEQPVMLPERPAVKTIGEALGYLTIVVDGRSCGLVSFVDESMRNADGDAVGKVTADDEACNTFGATVTFTGPNTPPLWKTFTLAPGREIVLDNLVPAPFSTDPDPLPPTTGTGLEEGPTSSGEIWLLAAAAVLFGAAFVTLRRTRR